MDLPGGKFDPAQDANLQKTAEREFREELGYDGRVLSFFLREGTIDYKGEVLILSFYTAALEREPCFSPNQEVMEWRWIEPTGALQMILSPEFEKRQREGIREYILEKEGYRSERSIGREYPWQAIETLRVLKQYQKD